MNKFQVLCLVAPMVLVGCSSSSDKQDPPPVEDHSQDAQQAEQYPEGQTGTYTDIGDTTGEAMETSGSGITPESINDQNSPLAIRTIYFSYDSSNIAAEGQNTLLYHAEYLNIVPSTRIILEGHTDERGTRDYNLALGERRAKSVQDFLVANGVSASQLEVRSYGEENPVAYENSEQAWQLNRRVELIYPAK